MIEWLGANAEKIGAGVIAVGGVLTVVWQWLVKNRVTTAKTAADVAIAASQAEVYSQMRERLTDLATHVERLTANVDLLREQLRERDHKVHSLELYVIDLQHILHTHGIDVPPMR